MSDHSTNELSHENGGSSDAVQQGDPVTIESDPNPAAKSESVKDDEDHRSPPRPASPVPGTSKSSGVRRRTSKDPKRSSPDTAKGELKFSHSCIWVGWLGTEWLACWTQV